MGTTFVPNQIIYSLTETGLIPTGAHAAVLKFTASGWQLTIPDRQIDTTFAIGETSKTIPDPTGNPLDRIQIAFVRGYSDFVMVGSYIYASRWDGAWGVFLNGYVSPDTALPFAGMATYTGIGMVGGLLHALNGNLYDVADIVGDVSLTADFGTNHLNGTFSNMIAVTEDNRSFPFNNVAFTGSVYQSGNGFFGYTSVTNAPGNPYSLKATASGYVYGQFFGPNAQQIGGLWSLHDGTSGAVGFLSGSGPVLSSPPSPAIPSENIRFLTVANLWGNIVTAGSPTVGNPAAASAGTSPAAAQLALPGGPQFDGSPSFPAVGTVFPLTQSVMQVTPSGAVADNTAMSGGASVKVGLSNNSATGLHFSAPGLGITESVLNPQSPIDRPTSAGVWGHNGGLTGLTGLSYTSYGVWYTLTAGPKADVTSFVFGYETPAANMPTSGTATYSGTQNVMGSAYIPGKFDKYIPLVQGDATFTANFSTGQVNGNFSNMKLHINNNEYDPSLIYPYPWNDISVSANILGGMAKFSGSTAVASTPAGASAPYVLKPSATGRIDGGFYGPNAENLGAVWTLSNGDGTGAAVGSVGAAIP